MSAIVQVYGIGKSKLVGTATEDASAPQKTYLLPLTEQGGFSVQWSDESFIHRLISLDITTMSIEERQQVINGFGNFNLSWAGLPMPYSFGEDIVELWNIRKRYTWEFYPKYEDYIGIPELSFAVNIIGTEGLTFQTSDTIYSPGTFGIKLFLRTVQNQQVTIGQATGVLAGGGSVFQAIEGGM